MKKTVVLFACFIVACVANVRAQSISPSTINAMGGSGSLLGNEYEWSIGEMTMVSTFTGSSVIVTQGVLQPWQAASGVSQTMLPADVLNVFPNPATSDVSLRYTAQSSGAIAYALYDLVGRRITGRTFNIAQGSNTENISLQSLASATYQLQLTITDGGNTTTTSFKIDKL